MKRNLILLMVLIVATAYGITLEGVGFGKTQDEAKDNALKDLSGFIESNVKTEISRVAQQSGSGSNSDYKEFVKTDLNVKTDLPIMGAEFELRGTRGDSYNFTAIARFNKDIAINLYKSKLVELKSEIDSALQNLDTASSMIQMKLMNELVSNITLFNKYKLVSVYLEVPGIPEIPVTKNDMLIKISKYHEESDTIAKSAGVIGEYFKQYQMVYSYPVTPADSNEITQFAKILNDYLLTVMSNKTDYANAKYYLKGNYEVLNDGLHLVSHLYDKNNQIVRSKITKLLPSAYSSYSFRPNHSQLSTILENAVSSSDMNLEITTNKGKSNLLFTQGEEIEVFVKANAASYLYFTGHILRNDTKMSYLLELNDAPDNRKFIMYIGHDVVNKWISLGKFEVAAPFGVESLQVFSSTKDPIQSIPGSRYDSETGYYVIGGGDAIAVVSATRGLRPVKTETVKTAETSLMFTTSDR